MKLLIIGGTQFLGRAITQAALDAGHTVTLFHRGQTNPDLFPHVEHLLGDRTQPEGLDLLKGRRWDAAVDTSGYVPRHVRTLAERLADSVAHYTFISSISVYTENLQPNADEDTARVQTLDDPATETVSGETYGGLKVLCEQAAEAAMPKRVLNVRSGLIVGAHDPTDRFTYWVARVAEGGQVLAPGSPDQHVQLIDARDEAEWILRMASAREVGLMNATGPAHPLTMGEVLETCKAVTNSRARFTWVNDAFLESQEIRPYVEMPLWLPARENAIQEVNIGRAVAHGLVFRPLEATTRAVYNWDKVRGNLPLRAGITTQRENELLAAWKVRKATGPLTLSR